METLHNGMAIAFKGSYVTVKDGVDGFENNDEDGGELDDGVRQVIDIVEYMQLQSTGFDKKGFKLFLKSYVKKIMAHLMEKHPEQVDEFKAGAAEFMKTLLANFKEYDFYTGSSMDPEGAICIAYWDGATPYFMFFSHALEIEKC